VLIICTFSKFDTFTPAGILFSICYMGYGWESESISKVRSLASMGIVSQLRSVNTDVYTLKVHTM